MAQSGDAGCEQRKRRAELAPEVMHLKYAPPADLLRRNGKLDRLQQRIQRQPHLRMRRRSPMAEGERADAFYTVE
jgi:hypothetical protein